MKNLKERFHLPLEYQISQAVFRWNPGGRKMSSGGCRWKAVEGFPPSNLPDPSTGSQELALVTANAPLVFPSPKGINNEIFHGVEAPS